MNHFTRLEFLVLDASFYDVKNRILLYELWARELRLQRYKAIFFSCSCHRIFQTGTLDKARMFNYLITFWMFSLVNTIIIISEHQIKLSDSLRVYLNDTARYLFKDIRLGNKCLWSYDDDASLL